MVKRPSACRDSPRRQKKPSASRVEVSNRGCSVGCLASLTRGAESLRQLPRNLAPSLLPRSRGPRLERNCGARNLKSGNILSMELSQHLPLTTGAPVPEAAREIIWDRLEAHGAEKRYKGTAKWAAKYERAVAEFQRKAGLQESGDLDAATWAALLRPSDQERKEAVPPTVVGVPVREPPRDDDTEPCVTLLDVDVEVDTPGADCVSTAGPVSTRRRPTLREMAADGSWHSVSNNGYALPKTGDMVLWHPDHNAVPRYLFVAAVLVDAGSGQRLISGLDDAGTEHRVVYAVQRTANAAVPGWYRRQRI